MEISDLKVEEMADGRIIAILKRFFTFVWLIALCQ